MLTSVKLNIQYFGPEIVSEFEKDKNGLYSHQVLYFFVPATGPLAFYRKIDCLDLFKSHFRIDFDNGLKTPYVLLALFDLFRVIEFLWHTLCVLLVALFSASLYF